MMWSFYGQVVKTLYAPSKQVVFMALDGIFLYHLKNEISEFAIDSRIEKIYQPAADELIFTLRSRQGARQLFLSCRADSARMQYTNFHFENPKVAPMLCMLLRKKLTGARIKEISQDGLERIIKFSLLAYDNFGEIVELNLICEFMGRYSNIILTDRDMNIIDALHRVGNEKSSVRTVLPGEKYCQPPKQHKINLLTNDTKQVLEEIGKSTKTPAKAFQDTVAGVSPIVAREFENGTSIDTIKHYAENPIKVAVVTDRPIDFTFMPIHQYGHIATIKEFETFSALLDYYYSEKIKQQRIAQRSGELLKRIKTLQEHTVRKIVNRENELKDCNNKEKYKLYGDLLSTNMYRLEKNKEFYDIENYYDNMNIIRIPVSPALSISQNIQKYYKEYRKRQVAETKLYSLIDEAKAELAYLESTAVLLENADNDHEISVIKSELADNGYLKISKIEKSKVKRAAPAQYVSDDGFTILVGKSNLMNEKLSLKIAKPTDMWFHAKDCPGSHVIIVDNKKEFSDEAIHTAAILAAANSKAGASSNVAVDYTLAKNVKKIPGSKPGMVNYTNYKTVFVTPSTEQIERINKIV